MKVVILAGGLGSRFAEETEVRPKPMIEIGGFPILWHIMKMYAHYGMTEFVVCLGYKGYVIKEYFTNYFLHASDVTIDLRRNELRVHNVTAEPWTVTLIDTGATTMTGGRLKRVREYLGNETFAFTYGDGVSDIPIDQLLAFHRASGRRATVTAVQPPGRFGAVEIDDGKVVAFHEKPRGDGSWINGGFFVLEPDVIDLIDGDDTVWEQGPLEQLAARGELSAFEHAGFWHAMDTQRDRIFLEQLWRTERAPWKLWA